MVVTVVAVVLGVLAATAFGPFAGDAGNVVADPSDDRRWGSARAEG